MADTLGHLRAHRAAPYRGSASSSERARRPDPASRRAHEWGRPDASRAAPETAQPDSGPDALGAQLKTAGDLTGKTWHVHRVTPLYRLSTDGAALLAYSRALEAKLRAAARPGDAVVVGADSEQGQVEVEIGIVAGVAMAERDSDALGIIIRQQRREGAGEEEDIEGDLAGYGGDAAGGGAGSSRRRALEATRAVVFQGVLCSAGDDRQERTPRSFSSLPVYLTKGKATITRRVSAFLETQFDCRVSPMLFPPAELAWMAALWGSAHMTTEVRRAPCRASQCRRRAKERAIHMSLAMPAARQLDRRSRRRRDIDAPPRPSPRPLELTFDVPPAVNGLGTLQLTIEAEAAGLLVAAVRADSMAASAANGAPIDAGAELAAAIERHFFNYFRIRLSAFSLSRIATSMAFVGSDGRLKMPHLPPASVLQVLQRLTALCLSPR